MPRSVKMGIWTRGDVANSHLMRELYKGSKSTTRRIAKKTRSDKEI